MNWIIWVTAGILLLAFIIAVFLNEKFKNTIISMGKYVWSTMEFNRLLSVLAAVFRTILRILSTPVLLIDKYIESKRKDLKKYLKSRGYTEQKAYSRMIENVIDAVIQNKGVVGKRNSKHIKLFCIVLLEMVSFITTAIGLTIVASDISPLVAIVWALVIQLLAGLISIQSGKRNIVILVVCLFVSTGSDYVCYINAVFPYDKYIESQYVDFKTSYDLAYQHAITLVRPYESSEETISTAFSGVNQVIRDIKANYQGDLALKQQRYAELEVQRSNTPATISNIIGYDPVINPVTGEQTGTTPRYSPPVPNPAYEAIINEMNSLSTDEGKAQRIMSAILGIEADVKNMAVTQDGVERSGEERAKFLLADLQDENILADEEQTKKLSEEFSVLSGQLSLVIQTINNLIAAESLTVAPLVENSLSDIRLGFANSNALNKLALPEFSEIRDSVAQENQSIFDKLFKGFAIVIDSDFIAGTVDLKKKTEVLTNERYEQFIQETSRLVLEDEQLKILISGNDAPEEGINAADVPLDTAKANLAYQDALSKALDHLFSREGKNSEVYSRLFFAMLADGLVLLIGFSLRKKRMSVYRMKNRRDLTKEEPQLIKEALYNMSAKTSEENQLKPYRVETLLWYLNDFISCFEVEPHMQNADLNESFSLVCKDAFKRQKLDNDYKELICVLQALKYIKPLGNEQNAHYYMTTGFSLYFSEIATGLYEHVENDRIRDELKRELEGLEMVGAK